MSRTGQFSTLSVNNLSIASDTDFDVGDAYAKYKSSTNEFINWLARKARSTGKAQHLLSQHPTSTHPNPSGAERYEVPSKNLTQLVKIVRAAAIAVPSRIITALETAINWRLQCSDWYDEHLPEGDIPGHCSTRGHRAFANVLRVAFKLLEPLVPSQSMASHTKSYEGEHAPDNITNSFAALELEEPATSDVPPVTTPGPQVTNHNVRQTDQRQYVLQRLEEDRILAAYDFLQRMVSLVNASMTTNAAIGEIRRLNDDLIASYPSFADHDAVCQCVKQLQANLNINSDPAKAMDINNVFFGESLELFHSLILTPLKEEEWPQVIPAPRFDKFSPEDLQSPQFIKALQYVSTMKCLYMYTVEMLSGSKVQAPPKTGTNLDEMSRAFNVMIERKRLETWQVFALELFVDMRRLIGQSNIDIGLGDIRSTSVWMEDSVKSYERFARAYQSQETCEGNCTTLENLCTRFYQFTATDCVQEMVNVADRNFGSDIEWPELFFLRNNPFACGLNQLLILSQFHHNASIIAGLKQDKLIAIMHLYSAVKQTGIAGPSFRWDDLEWLIAKHGENYFFCGNRPADPHECHKRLVYAAGWSSRAFSKEMQTRVEVALRRKQPLPHMPRSPKGMRQLKPLSLITSHFVDDLNHSTARHETNFRDMRAVNLLAVSEMLIGPHYKTAATRDDTAKNASQREYASVARLQVLEDLLEREVVALNFDLFSLLESCTLFLAQIQQDLSNRFPKLFLPAVFSQPENFGLLVVHIFQYADLTGFTDNAAFQAVAAAMSRFVEKSGSCEINKAHCRYVPPNVDKELLEKHFKRLPVPQDVQDLRKDLRRLESRRRRHRNKWEAKEKRGN